jgi:hypothetical protein
MFDDHYVILGVGLGESCKDKDQCSFTNAECESELCACPAGTYPSGTSCMPGKIQTYTL